MKFSPVMHLALSEGVWRFVSGWSRWIWCIFSFWSTLLFIGDGYYSLTSVLSSLTTRTFSLYCNKLYYNKPSTVGEGVVKTVTRLRPIRVLVVFAKWSKHLFCDLYYFSVFSYYHWRLLIYCCTFHKNIYKRRPANTSSKVCMNWKDDKTGTCDSF
jgi:hypothetical protein